jgi:hypothetical protein
VAKGGNSTVTEKETAKQEEEKAGNGDIAPGKE